VMWMILATVCRGSSALSVIPPPPGGMQGECPYEQLTREDARVIGQMT